MKREARFIWVVAVFAVVSVFASCRHKPAYSDVDSNKSAARQSGADRPASAEPQAASGAQQPAAPVEKTKPPAFFDSRTGSIIDLPNYPRAQRVNVEMGSAQGVSTLSMVLDSSDPMDKITAFYDEAVKNNRWTVADRVIDPESSEWTLTKGDDNSAKIQVRKNTQTGRMTIVVVRGEKPGAK